MVKLIIFGQIFTGKTPVRTTQMVNIFCRIDPLKMWGIWSCFLRVCLHDNNVLKNVMFFRSVFEKFCVRTTTLVKMFPVHLERQKRLKMLYYACTNTVLQSAIFCFGCQLLTKQKVIHVCMMSPFTVHKFAFWYYKQRWYCFQKHTLWNSFSNVCV